MAEHRDVWHYQYEQRPYAPIILILKGDAVKGYISVQGEGVASEVISFLQKAGLKDALPSNAGDS